MMLKPLAVAVLAVSFLTACSSNPTKNNSDTIVFTEPELTAPFYALNPFNYDAPPPFEINLKKVPIKSGFLLNFKRYNWPFCMVY